MISFENNVIMVTEDRVLYIYISDGFYTEFYIYYFILYLFEVVNNSIFSLIMLIESGILLENHVSCNLPHSFFSTIYENFKSVFY